MTCILNLEHLRTFDSARINVPIPGCVEECRFYADQGRIEDEEVIAKHNEFVESLRQENAIVEPPSEGELLELAKITKIN